MDTMAQDHLSIARNLVDDPLFAGDITNLHVDFMSYFLSFLERYGGDQITGLPWFRDGLTKGEAALVVVLSANALYGPLFELPYDQHLIQPGDPLFRALTQGDGVSSQKLSLSSGDVDLHIIREPSLRHEDNSLFLLLSNAVEELERVMGPPWVKGDVIVYWYPAPKEEVILRVGSRAGRNVGSHLTVRVRSGHPRFKRVIYHETAHFYGRFLPGWMNEGFPEYMASYILKVRDNESLETSYEYAQKAAATICPANDYNRIQDLLERGPTLLGYLGCNYHMPHSFVLRMNFALGHETVSAAFRELYRMDDNDKTAGSLEEKMYLAILSNTPPGKKDQFRELYRELHGGPVPDS